MEALAGWEQESPSVPAPEAGPTEGSANEPTAPATEDADVQAASPESADGTPAAKDQQAPDKNQKQQQQPKPGEKPGDKPDAPGKQPETQPPTSKFAKDQERRMGSWKELNAEKELVRTTKQALEERKAQLDQREQALKQRETKLSQPKYKPEDYERGADQWETEAKKLEDAGDYAKADRLRAKAEDAREYAKQLRANPPQPDPTEAQEREAHQKAQREWWGKAAVDYPNVVKDGTPERAALLELLKNEPDLVNDPKGMYYASRLVTAEALSARVPTLQKDLDAALARVKELEELTAVPTDGSVQANRGAKTFAEMTPQEQESALAAEAQSIGYIN